ncbi:MAG: hypothetical protein HUJ29_05915 [Gammaproteobacteria bacterium]|nr:hypothetical protein [Gammaproteobacteria bacterium]
MEVDAMARSQVNEGMIAGTALFGLLIGILLFMAGLRARIYWLPLWGGGLALASLAYLGYALFSGS